MYHNLDSIAISFLIHKLAVKQNNILDVSRKDDKHDDY